MEQEKQLQWFPGHMMKAMRAIETKLPIIDVVVEILDARAPMACENNELKKLIKNKTRIVILNKADLADKNITDLWVKHFQANNVSVLLTNSLTQKIKPKLIEEINLVFSEKLARQVAKGIKNPQIRVLIFGLPNVGKSTFINNLLQRKVTKTADCPGVTRGQQWIRLNNTIDLLDNPGILSPKIEDDQTKLLLVLIKALPSKHLFLEEIANYALKFLMKNYSHNLLKYYQIEFDSNNINNESLEKYFQALAQKYNLKLFENQWNVHRAMNLLIHDLQTGKLGLISFQKPNNL